MIQRQHSKTPFRKNIIITLYYHKTKNYILSQTQQLSLSTMLYLLRMFYISAAIFPDLREVSISHTNSVPLVGRKLLRQAGQSLDKRIHRFRLQVCEVFAKVNRANQPGAHRNPPRSIAN